MTEYNSPQSDPDPDVQPQDQSPDDLIDVQLPAWEMRMPGAPIPNEDEDRPADKIGYYDNPLNRRFTTSVNPPWRHGNVPIVHRPEIDPQR